MTLHSKYRMAAMSIVALAGSHTLGADRDVQITRVFADTRVIEVTNTGSTTIPLTRWQFCSHNSVSVFNYTISSALSDISLSPQESFGIYMNNDADPSDPSQINQQDLGAFAAFELGAYSLSLYSPGSQGFIFFGDGNQMVDHIQWSIDGLDNFSADERSDEAVFGGLWTNQEVWINVQNDTTLIELNDPTFGELHGPSDYNVAGAISCPADLTGDGMLNFFDVSAFLSAFTTMDPAADFTNDGLYNFFDVSAFLGAFTVGCP